jgi:hypothetical protein
MVENEEDIKLESDAVRIVLRASSNASGKARSHLYNKYLRSLLTAKATSKEEEKAAMQEGLNMLTKGLLTNLVAVVTINSKIKHVEALQEAGLLTSVQAGHLMHNFGNDLAKSKSTYEVTQDKQVEQLYKRQKTGFIDRHVEDDDTATPESKSSADHDEAASSKAAAAAIVPVDSTLEAAIDVVVEVDAGGESKLNKETTDSHDAVARPNQFIIEESRRRQTARQAKEAATAAANADVVRAPASYLKQEDRRRKAEANAATATQAGITVFQPSVTHSIKGKNRASPADVALDIKASEGGGGGGGGGNGGGGVRSGPRGFVLRSPNPDQDRDQSGGGDDGSDISSDVPASPCPPAVTRFVERNNVATPPKSGAAKLKSAEMATDAMNTSKSTKKKILKAKSIEEELAREGGAPEDEDGESETML